jgi:hypothetical protein
MKFHLSTLNLCHMLPIVLTLMFNLFKMEDFCMNRLDRLRLRKYGWDRKSDEEKKLAVRPSLKYFCFVLNRHE